jgi:hypothetical protein
MESLKITRDELIKINEKRVSDQCRTLMDELVKAVNAVDFKENHVVIPPGRYCRRYVQFSSISDVHVAADKCKKACGTTMWSKLVKEYFEPHGLTIDVEMIEGEPQEYVGDSNTYYTRLYFIESKPPSLTPKKKPKKQK